MNATEARTAMADSVAGQPTAVILNSLALTDTVLTGPLAKGEYVKVVLIREVLMGELERRFPEVVPEWSAALDRGEDADLWAMYAEVAS